MKSSTEILFVIAALVGAAVAASIASAADSPAAPTAPPERVGPPPEVMDIYDVDHNGVLDDDERAVLHEDIASGKFIPPGAEGRGRGPHGPGGPHGRGLPPEVRAKYDANNDGHLDDTERSALRADVAAGKVKLPAHRGLRQPPPEIMAQYDTNKDGKLDDTERAVLHADIESGKLPPPPNGRGRGPGPDPQGTPTGTN